MNERVFTIAVATWKERDKGVVCWPTPADGEVLGLNTREGPPQFRKSNASLEVSSLLGQSG